MRLCCALMEFMRGSPERIFGMKKYKRKGRSILFCTLFWAIFFLSMPVPSQASFIGFETLEYTDENYKSCNLQEELGQAVGGKWWEAPLTAILDASVAVGENTFNSVAGGARKFMVVGFGLWLALFVLRVVGGMQESDPMDNFTKIGGMMLKTGIASVLLMNSNFFFSYFFSPVIQAGSAFVNIGQSVSVGNGGLSEAASALKTMAEGIHDSTAQMIGRADFLNCILHIHVFQIMGKTIFTLQDPGGWATSCMIRMGAVALCFAFPFFLMDAAFRMGVTAALCPLFIIAWVFPVTADFAKKGFNSLLNLAFTFMMLKIVMDMAVQLLMAAAGISGLEQDKESQKKYVCLFKWAHLGSGEDTCLSGGQPVYEDEGSNVLVFFVCVIYALMLMKSAEKLANFFSDTNFENKSFFEASKGAGQIMGNGIKHGVQAAGAVQDRVALHNDRAAARTVEKDRQARETAQKGGTPYTPPTGRDAKRLDKATQRLQRKGILKADGSETKRYAELLKNGKARTLMRGLENVRSRKAFADAYNAGTYAHNKFADSGVGRFFGVKRHNYISTEAMEKKHNKFEDLGKSHPGLRSAEQVQSLDAVGSTARQSDAKNATDRAKAAQQRFDHAPSNRYDMALVGQKEFDRDMVSHEQRMAQYKQKVAKDSSYAGSMKGRDEYNNLMSEEKNLNKRQQQGGFDDYIRTGVQPRGYGYSSPFNTDSSNTVAPEGGSSGASGGTSSSGGGSGNK